MYGEQAKRDRLYGIKRLFGWRDTTHPAADPDGSHDQQVGDQPGQEINHCHKNRQNEKVHIGCRKHRRKIMVQLNFPLKS